MRQFRVVTEMFFSEEVFFFLCHTYHYTKHHLQTSCCNEIFGSYSLFSNFLAQMGFGIRLRRLLESCKSKVERDQLLKSSSYLMSDDEMGHRFKMLSLFPKTMESIMGKRGGSPAGFGIL